MKMKWEEASKPVTLYDIQIQVGNGWANIIARLVADLEKLGWNGTVAQVKEKFGTLRFYIGDGSTEIFNRVHEAEKESETTCEWCGKPGELDQRLHWLLTLCPECREIRGGKSAIARAKKRGIVVTPSMVWLHVSCFQDQSDKEIADAKAESDQRVGDREEE